VNIGIMLYGYDEPASGSIMTFLEKLTAKEIIGASASGREKERVTVIVGAPTWDAFEDKKNKILMFLGFSDDMLGSAMKHFPADLERPIFCALTDQNVNWTFDYLVEHLLEEKARFSD